LGLVRTSLKLKAKKATTPKSRLKVTRVIAKGLSLRQKTLKKRWMRLPWTRLRMQMTPLREAVVVAEEAIEVLSKSLAAEETEQSNKLNAGAADVGTEICSI